MIQIPDGASDVVVSLMVLGWMFTTWLNTRTAKATGREIAEVKDQVANTHSTNLRDDIDEIHKDVKRVVDKVDTLDNRVIKLHDQVIDNRDHLSQFEAEVRAFATRNHPGDKL